MTFNLNKTKWCKVSFSDVAENVNETLKNPEHHGIERFLGLEHIVPGELRISRFGQVSEGTTFTKRVRPGQVLFGKRRAYQKKVARADFEAVCSGDILVFQTRSSGLHPDLLPFVVMSDGFFQRAIETSAGSLSPRTRWSDLAKYEFLLPPLDEQENLAALLWAIEEHRQSLICLEVALGHMRDAWALAQMQKVEKLETLKSVAQITMGQSPDGSTINEDALGKPFFQGNSDFGLRSPQVRSYTSSPRKHAKEGDILFSVRAPVGDVNVAPCDCAIGRGLAAIHPNNETDLEYLITVLKLAKRELDRLSTGSIFPAIRRIDLVELEVPWPNAQARIRIQQELAHIDQANSALRVNIQESEALRSSILREMWSQ